PDLGLVVAAHGGAFAGTSVDIGTRFLLGHLAEAALGARTAVDLGCGTGVLATSLAMHRPGLHVLASDQSAAAVASAWDTALANGVGEQVKVVRDDGLSRQPDGSAELIVLNPPFHVGAAVHAGIALKLFEHAARVLAPGGELWCVWNSHLAYTPALRSIIGPTRQIARNTKFTITASTRAQ
ncbi:class I SAM-dependent methyltransferase, partial [Kitasatospora indigofera]